VASASGLLKRIVVFLSPYYSLDCCKCTRCPVSADSSTAMYESFATWAEVVVMGIVSGLIACGLYSGQKAVRADWRPSVSFRKLPFKRR
jgi:hypothetical protein